MSISHLISEDTRKEMAELKILINKYVKLPAKVRNCKWCNREIQYTKGGDGQSYIKDGYCDLICKEFDTPPEPVKVCEKCGNALMAHKNKYGKSTGMYSKKCEECINPTYLNGKKTQPLSRKCKLCGDVKLIKFFRFFKKENTYSWECSFCVSVKRKKKYKLLKINK